MTMQFGNLGIHIRRLSMRMLG